MHIKYDKSTNQIEFDIAGTSDAVQNVTAILTVTAYGRQLDQREFNFCDEGIEMLCPGTIPFPRFLCPLVLMLLSALRKLCSKG